MRLQEGDFSAEPTKEMGRHNKHSCFRMRPKGIYPREQGKTEIDKFLYLSFELS